MMNSHERSLKLEQCMKIRIGDLIFRRAEVDSMSGTYSCDSLKKNLMIGYERIGQNVAVIYLMSFEARDAALDNEIWNKRYTPNTRTWDLVLIDKRLRLVSLFHSGFDLVRKV